MIWFKKYIPYYLKWRRAEKKNQELDDRIIILLGKIANREGRIDNLIGQLAACKQPGDPASKLLAALAHIERQPKYWWDIEQAVIAHFKDPDINIVPVDSAEHSAWLGPIQAQIVKHPGYVLRNRDLDYTTFATFDDFERAVKSLWVHFVPYVPDEFDCEDLAELLRILLILVYHANCPAYTESEWTDSYHGSMAHAWLCCFIPGGESAKAEPQTATVYIFEEENLGEPYKTKNMRIYRR